MQTAHPVVSEYAAALETYLHGGGDSVLYQASEIGRRMQGGRHGVLAIIGLHHAALDSLLATAASVDAVRDILHASEAFLQYALSSLEVARELPCGPDEASGLIAEFAGTLSHEIRAPLTSVLASAGMLEEVRGPELDEQERQLLRNVIEGGLGIKRRTDDLMDLVGFQSGSVSLDYTEVELRPYLVGVLHRLEPSARDAGLELSVRLPERMPRRFGLDAERIEQVIASLVQNAIKFGGGGRKIEVRVSVRGPLSVEVRDRGRGIPTDAQAGLFHPFGRASNGKQQRLGLGLALCREIVAAHGGRLLLDSAEGKGTIVRFDIPSRYADHE